MVHIPMATTLGATYKAVSGSSRWCASGAGEYWRGAGAGAASSADTQPPRSATLLHTTAASVRAALPSTRICGQYTRYLS